MSKLTEIPSTICLEAFLEEGVRQTGGKKQASIITTVCKELGELKGWARQSQETSARLTEENSDLVKMMEALRQYLEDQIEKLQAENKSGDEFLNGSIAALYRVADMVEDDVGFIYASQPGDDEEDTGDDTVILEETPDEIVYGPHAPPG